MDPTNGKVEIVWRSINVESIKGPFKETVIHRVQGKIGPSEMTVLVGASGSGKTTMVNAIIGKPMEGLRISGEVLLNGHFADARVWEHAVGFVGEHLHSYETQTVEETLRFAVMASRNRDQRIIVAEEVPNLIHSLGLYKVAHIPVSSISTGERVRLSLGIILAKRPSVLIIDEVTNDLDLLNIIHILNILMDLKSKGKGIMVSFQRVPKEILSFFDRIIMICQGEIVFSGSLRECKSFLKKCGYNLKKHENPLDFFMKILSIDMASPVSERESTRRIERLKASWKRIEPLAISSIIEKIELPVMLQKSFLSFLLVLERNLSDFSRRRGLMRTLSVQKLVTLLFLVLVYFRLDYTQKGIRDRFGILSFMVISGLERSIASSIIFIDSHKKALRREVCAGMYGAVESYFANVMSSFFISGIPSVLYTVVVYWVVGLNPGLLQFILFVFVFVMLVLFSISFGVIVSLHTKTLIHAQVVSSTVAALFIMLGGMFVNPEEAPEFVKWTVWMSPVYYAFETILQSQFENLTFECKDSERCIPNGREALHLYGFRRVRYSTSIGIFFLITLMSFIFGIVSMKKVIKPKNVI
ncbi:ABCG transporter [Encephalitozoon intestinalis ATCC 50506]|uniref:ABCG transporter n=1 Tax=Encephalitozoon intestinalis (strain ATCC 50506) TaxID=876142 RepID=E0S7X9_ENCIT|nr:ABCG transporter [Encephalitozoon intestinalis ATCC 50506]ADM11814.1 ABCG transporter [Encephalitozoon intestinalis ATCC 50506]UTX45564.1 sterolin [Encephalitozoon intestinalis]